MVDRTDAQRPHAGYDHGAVKGGEPQDFARHQPEIVEKAQQIDRPAAEQSGDQRQDSVEPVEFAPVIRRILHGGDGTVEFFVNLIHGIVRLKVYLDAGVGGVDGHPLLDGHDDLNPLACVNLLPADKAVERRALGDGTQIGRDEDMQKAEIRHALPHLFAAEAVGLGDVDGIGKEIAGVGALGHDVGHHPGHGIDRAEKIAVRAVAPATAAFFCGCCFVHSFLSFRIVKSAVQKRLPLYYNQKSRVLQVFFAKKIRHGLKKTEKYAILDTVLIRNEDFRP